MKSSLSYALLAVGTLCAAASIALAADIGTAFTYQGHLENASGPVTDTCDFRFSLWDAAAGGNQRGDSPQTVALVEVEAGVFTAPIDFGTGAVDGTGLWLEVEVQCLGDADFTLLSPRVELTATPYSLRARDGVGGPGAVTVASSGDVGIGTQSPISRLHIMDPSTHILLESDNPIGDIPLVFWNSADNQNWQLRYYGNNNKSLNILDGTNGAYRTTWFPNGNVGIGTTAPGARLAIQQGVNDSTGGLRLIAATAANHWNLHHNGADENFAITRNNGTPALTIRASDGNLGVGTTEPTARLTLNGGNLLIDANAGSILLDSNGPDLSIGATYIGTTTAHDFYLRTSSTDRITITGAGNVGIGTTAPSSKLHVSGETTTTVLTITGGSDLAEPFDMVEDHVEPGMVVVIARDEPGKLRLSREPYDATVAGVVSGAGGIKPGMTMSQSEKFDGGHPVALTGRVYCWCDASSAPIHPGDLLTTSTTPGHAMKVTDRTLANGAIIGKALTPLSEDRGLVLIVVALQ